VNLDPSIVVTSACCFFDKRVRVMRRGACPGRAIEAGRAPRDVSSQAVRLRSCSVHKFGVRATIVQVCVQTHAAWMHIGNIACACALAAHAWHCPSCKHSKLHGAHSAAELGCVTLSWLACTHTHTHTVIYS
jgi:hypothetical protein